MKTAINYIQDVKYRVLEDQLSRKEAVLIFVSLFAVSTLSLVLFAPQGWMK
jgi:hypothetical protein